MIERTIILEELNFKDFSEKCGHNVPSWKCKNGKCDLLIFSYTKNRVTKLILSKSFDVCSMGKCPLWIRE
jgi:hypothetical protein